jgi:hypothetical protein
VAAIGGALAIGGWIRLAKLASVKDAVLAGLGLSILSHTRPYEGASVCAVMGVALLIWLVRDRTIASAVKLRRVVAPLAIVLALNGALHLYYNYRVTGDPLKLPYQRNRELYGTPQTFYWQAPSQAVPSPHKEINDNYRWQLEMHSQGKTLETFVAQGRIKLREFWLFYFGAAWLVPLVLVPWVIRGERLWAPTSAVLGVLAATSMYPFFFPHYLAPIAPVFPLLIVSGLRRMREYAWGVTLSRLLTLSVAIVMTAQLGADSLEATRKRQYKTPRTQVMEALEKAGENHVVFVRYAPDHDFNHEIVYNAANIDGSAVVWARDMGFVENQRVVEHYRGRKFWIFQPDERPPRLVPYP